MSHAHKVHVSDDGKKLTSVHSYDEKKIKKDIQAAQDGHEIYKMNKAYSRRACVIPEDLAMKWRMEGRDIARAPVKDIKKWLIAEGRIDCINPDGPTKSFSFGGK